MAKRNAHLPSIKPTFNPVGVANKIRGGALATQVSRDAALYSQMRIINHGCRTVCRSGFDGQVTCLVPDGLNPSNVNQVYPLGLAERIMARSRVRLTPGYSLVARAICLPTGPAQLFQGGGGAWAEDQSRPAGHIRIDVTFDNGLATAVATRKLIPSVSTEAYKGLPSGAGAAWGAVELMKGGGLDNPSSGDPGWVEHVTVDVTITAVGGVRPLDVEVYETPGSALHDEDHREGCVPLSVEQIQPALELAVTGRAPSADNRWGSQQANKSMNDQRNILGPILAYWSCWNEDAVAVTATEGTATAFTLTSFRELGYTGTSYSATAPGFSVSSGAYARNLEQSGPLELRGVNGVIPCTVRVWARMTTAAHVGTIRFQTATGYSYRDITVTGSTTFRWYSGLAWLRVPPHASLDSQLQILGMVAGAGQQLEVRYALVEYGGHYETAE